MLEGHFDYVVIGGGGSGVVLARKLAENPRVTVALLEAGPSDEERPEVADFRRYQEVAWGPLSPRLPIVPPIIGNGRVMYPVGRLLGGCTSHNSCIWFRPPDSDFLDWERLGGSGWGPRDVRSCFREIETRVSVETYVAGSAAHRDLLQGCNEIGFRTVDFSKPFDVGVGHYRFSKIGNLRQSSSVVYLHPLATLPVNLLVLTDTAARQLIFGPGGEVVGVDTHRGPVRARREVILTAGTFGTPKLLMLSGIGPGQLLRDLGIPVRRDLPGVGARFLDHPACAINFAASRQSERLDLWNYAGVLFARIEESALWPDVEMQLGAELYEQETKPAGYPSAPGGFCAYFTVNRARSEGSVRLASPDPDATVRVDPNFFGDPDQYDLSVMVGAIRLARRLFSTRSIAPWISAEIAPGGACQSDEAIIAFLRNTVTTGYHPAGTCRMGPAADPQSVVGADLKIWGVPRLRVADASVFPSMVSVNIASTCMMVGLRCAQLICHENVG